jgi:hypothetical protein
MVKMYFVACFVNMGGKIENGKDEIRFEAKERWNIGRMELDVPSSKRGGLLREDGKIE